MTAETIGKPEIPKADMAAIADELVAEGDPISPIIQDDLDYPPLINALESSVGSELKEYVRHSNRYFETAWRRDSEIFGEVVAIPPAADNLHREGQPRRHEEGQLIDMDAVQQAGIDPFHVLYFRVTQPSVSPAPEYYWTSDFSETRHGLHKELGASAKTAVILVSTLGHIAQNGGLMRDINDDSGVAVRQIGFAPFDQQSEGVLAILPRNG